MVAVAFLFYLVWVITSFKHSKAIWQHICMGSKDFVIILSSVSRGRGFVLLNCLLYPTSHASVSPCSGHLRIQSTQSDTAYQCGLRPVAPSQNSYFLLSWSSIATTGLSCDLTLGNNLVVRSLGEGQGDTSSCNAEVSALSSNKRGTLYCFKERTTFTYKE